jgi:hypothetical protein
MNLLIKRIIEQELLSVYKCSIAMICSQRISLTRVMIQASLEEMP